MIRALAESARLSNLPTVWTNALVGAALAGGGGPAWPIVAAVLAASLLYAGGMLLNDAMDASWDREHKPSRPIAAGRLSARLVASLAMFCLLGGVGLALGRGPGAGGCAGALLASIVLYNWLHKRSAWAAVFMAACRALLYPLAALMVAPEPAHAVWPASAAIAAYTLLLTLAARREDTAGARVSNWIAWLVPAPFLLAATAYEPGRSAWEILAAAAFLAWSTLAARDAVRGRIPGAVAAWIAGFCLADALMLALLARLDLALVAAIGWLATTTGQRRIAGT
mgnify:CR=1 FL=1